MQKLSGRLSRLDVPDVKNGLAKELLAKQPPAVLLRRTCFSNRVRPFFTSFTQASSDARIEPSNLGPAPYAQTC